MSILLLLSFGAIAQAGTWVTSKIENSSGTLQYKLWVPAKYSKQTKAPLVLMLHGCMQGPDDVAALAGMNELADSETFLIVYPEQTTAANPLRCWNWFDPKHQLRGSGEPSLIAAVVQDVQSNYSVDPDRVYSVGISAGAAMTVVMGVAYPELFAGLGVVIGAEYKAGTSVEAGLAAMKSGGPDPAQQGVLAFKSIQNGSAQKPVKRIPLIAFHGTKDPYLNPLNTEQLIAQWAKTNDYLDDGKDNNSVTTQSAKEVDGSVPSGYSYKKYSYFDRNGHLLMEKWIVDGMGHAWPGSRIASPFADAKAPNATAEIWRFFGETTTASKEKKR
jgi:poly(hydroxyalkanoate) depolymerase family esterase